MAPLKPHLHALRMRLRAGRAAARLPATATGEPLGGGAEFRPLAQDSLEAILDWLADPSVARWLDFGGGQSLTRAQATLFMTAPANTVRVIHGSDGSAVGFMSYLHHQGPARTAAIWVVRRPGELPPRLSDRPDRPGEPKAARMARNMRERTLSFAFEDLGLVSLSAWAAETNLPSISVLRAYGFREFGRQRRCHWIEGRHVDRIHFDMLAEEWRERRDRAAKRREPASNAPL